MTVKELAENYGLKTSMVVKKFYFKNKFVTLWLSAGVDSLEQTKTEFYYCCTTVHLAQ